MSLRPDALRVALLLASLAATSAELTAQQLDSAPLLRGPTVGVALDRFLADGGAGVTAVSLRITALNPGGFGVDFAAGTYLPALADGVVLLGMDLGPAYNLAGVNATRLLKLGASTIIADGGGALWGGYVGAGLIARAGGRLGIRCDIVKRLYIVPGWGPGTIWTVSFGLTSLRAGS